MHNFGRLLFPVLLAAGALAVAGCGGGGSSVTPAPQNAVVAGEYIGTLTDSVAGSQPAATTLSQHGTAVGGTLTIGSGNATSTESVAWAVAGNALSGSGLMDVGSATCAFTFTATYANNTITGSYSAANNCAGRTGTFSLSQQCTDPATSLDRRVKDVILPC